MTDEVSRRVVEQRVRNRVIEYLELVADFPAQEVYARAVPFVNVPFEVIAQWRDWVPTDPRAEVHIAAVYSAEETGALQRFESVWEKTSAELPEDFPALSKVLALPGWLSLRDEASRALAVFSVRGRMAEDHEGV